MQQINHEYRNLVQQFFSSIQDRLCKYSQYDSNIVRLILDYICYIETKDDRITMMCNQIKIWTIHKHNNLHYFKKIVRNYDRHRQYRHYPKYHLSINELYHKKKITTYLFYKKNKIAEINNDNIMFSSVRHIKQQILSFSKNEKKGKFPYIISQKKWSQFISQKIECKQTKYWIVRRFDRKTNKLILEQGYNHDNIMLYEIKYKNKKTLIEIYTNHFYNGFSLQLNCNKKITKIVQF